MIKGVGWLVKEDPEEEDLEKDSLEEVEAP